MWSTAGSSRESRRKSEIACHSCRRRKVKCDRGYPQCSVCQQTGQTCNYPQGPLKPGPKIGTLQCPRKRRRESDSQQNPVPAQSRFQSNSVRTETQIIDSASYAPNGHYSCDKGMPLAGQEQGGSTKRRRDSHLNIYDLSFILHPSHEASTPEKERGMTSNKNDIHQEPVLRQRVCSALGVGQATLEEMVKCYFDNMVAINLFHEPSFRERVNGVASTSEMHALLAAVLAYAARFYTTEANKTTNYAFTNTDTAETHLQAGHWLNLAFGNIESALKECGDEAPSLCVLQALIIATHCQLTQGVRGKAWRSLGTCIRLAYELNLHLVDAGRGKDVQDVDVQQWCDDEEKRRAWWAIWEMDVFASTIRRTPPAVDWSQIETFLPVEDQYWFEKKPQPSCFMERDLIYRWKALQESGNQCPKAWFLVVNSLMKDAQVISTPRSVPYQSPPKETDKAPPHADNRRPKQVRDVVEEATQKLETLANSVHCFTLALPAHLQYRNQYLGFDARAPGQMMSLRQLHCSIYNIYVMTQLAKLMIYRYDVFGGRCPTARRTHDSFSVGTAKASQAPRPSSASYAHDAEHMALAQYFEAADNILMIVNRSCSAHIRYINPFLSSTIWLASAVQLLRKEFGRDETSRTLIKSKFEVLCMTHKRCVSFWDVHTALQQNLEALEAQLEGCRKPVPSSHKRSFDNSATVTDHCGGENPQVQYEASYFQTNEDHMDTGCETDYNEASIQTKRSHIRRPSPSVVRNQPESSVTDAANCESNNDGSPPLPGVFQTPPASIADAEPPPHRKSSQQQSLPGAIRKPTHASPSTQNFSSGLTNISMLDYMTLSSHVDRHQPLTGDHNNNNQDHLNPGSGLLDPVFMLNATPEQPEGMPTSSDATSSSAHFGQYPDWRNIELPSDIHDLLSGFSTYLAS